MLRRLLPFQGIMRGLGTGRVLYPWELKVADKGKGVLFSMILPSSDPRRRLIDVCALNLITGVCEPLAWALLGGVHRCPWLCCYLPLPFFSSSFLLSASVCGAASPTLHGSFMLLVAPGTVHLGKAYLISVKSFDFPTCPQFPSLLKSSITMRTWTHQSKNVNKLVKYLSLSLNISGNSKQKKFLGSYSQYPPKWKAVSCWVNEFSIKHKLPILWIQLSLHKSTCINSSVPYLWCVCVCVCVCAFLTAIFISALWDGGVACDFPQIFFCILTLRSK